MKGCLYVRLVAYTTDVGDTVRVRLVAYTTDVGECSSCCLHK